LNGKPRIRIHDSLVLDADTETVEVATSGPVTSVICCCFFSYLSRLPNIKGREALAAINKWHLKPMTLGRSLEIWTL